MTSAQKRAQPAQTHPLLERVLLGLQAGLLAGDLDEVLDDLALGQRDRQPRPLERLRLVLLLALRRAPRALAPLPRLRL